MGDAGDGTPRPPDPAPPTSPAGWGEFDVAISEIDPEVAEFVCKKARLLSRRAGHSISDESDLRQELTVRLLDQGENLTRADWPNLRQAVKCIVSKIIRHRCAKIRDFRRTAPLSSEPVSGDRRHGRDHREVQSAADLAVDMAIEIERLPPDLKRLAELLLDRDLNDSEAARVLGVPRTTVAYRRSVLQRRFREAGLDRYLSRPIRQFAPAPGSE